MASTLITNAMLKAAISSVSSDEKLEILIDGFDARIIEAAGPHPNPLSTDANDVRERNRRKLALVQLVQLADRYEGVRSEREGSVSEIAADIKKEEERIFGSILPRVIV